MKDLIETLNRAHELDEAAFSGGMAGDNSFSGGTIRGRGASTQPSKKNYLNRLKNKNPDLVDTMVINVGDIKTGMITQAGQVKEVEVRDHVSGGKKMYIMHTNGYDGFWRLDETMDVMVDPDNKSKPFTGDYRSLLKMGLQEGCGLDEGTFSRVINKIRRATLDEHDRYARRLFNFVDKFKKEFGIAAETKNAGYGYTVENGKEIRNYRVYINFDKEIGAQFFVDGKAHRGLRPEYASRFTMNGANNYKPNDAMADGEIQVELNYDSAYFDMHVILDTEHGELDRKRAEKRFSRAYSLEEDKEMSVAIMSGISTAVSKAKEGIQPCMNELEASLVEYFDKYKTQLEAEESIKVKDELDNFLTYINITIVDKINTFKNQLK